MKKLVLILTLLVLINSVRSELVAPGSVIDLSAKDSAATSIDIKDVIKADLLRPYGSDVFQIDVNQLPSVNDNPYLLTKLTDKPVTMTPGNLDISGKGIKFINGNAFLMPMTKYDLAKNLRLYDYGDKLVIEDSKLNFNTNKAVIKDGIVYLGEKEVPVKVMPNMILNDFLIMFGDKNFKKISVETTNDKVEYVYTFTKPAKILYLIGTNVDVDIVVDGQTGEYNIKKPFWSIFTTGENAGIKEYNFTKYAAF